MKDGNELFTFTVTLTRSEIELMRYLVSSTKEECILGLNLKIANSLIDANYIK
jgi:hypothetical protein